MRRASRGSRGRQERTRAVRSSKPALEGHCSRLSRCARSTLSTVLAMLRCVGRSAELASTPIRVHPESSMRCDSWHRGRQRASDMCPCCADADLAYGRAVHTTGACDGLVRLTCCVTSAHVQNNLVADLRAAVSAPTSWRSRQTQSVSTRVRPCCRSNRTGTPIAQQTALTRSPHTFRDYQPCGIGHCAAYDVAAQTGWNHVVLRVRECVVDAI